MPLKRANDLRQHKGVKRDVQALSTRVSEEEEVSVSQ